MEGVLQCLEDMVARRALMLQQLRHTRPDWDAAFSTAGSDLLNALTADLADLEQVRDMLRISVPTLKKAI